MNRGARTMVALTVAALAAMACGTADGPSTAPNMVMEASDVSVSMTPIVEGDTSFITITNHHPYLTLVHGGLAARVDVWNGRVWRIMRPTPGSLGEAFLVKQDLVFLAPGETRSLPVDDSASIEPGEFDLALHVGFIRDVPWPYVGGLKPTVRLVVSPALDGAP